MQYPVATNLVLDASISPGTTEYSRAVDLAADNNASFDCTLLSITSGGSLGTLTVALQGSNDLANWTTVTTSTSNAVPDVINNKYSSAVQWGYVRLKYTAIGGGTDKIVLAAGINTVKVGVQ